MKAPTPTGMAWKAMLIAAALAAGVASPVGCAAAQWTPSLGNSPLGRMKAAFFVAAPNFEALRRGHGRMDGGGTTQHSLRDILEYQRTPLNQAILNSNKVVRYYATSKEPFSEEPVSEPDAVRILRALPRFHNKDERDQMKSCHSALDVLSLLSQASTLPTNIESIDFVSSSSHQLSISKDELLAIIKPIVDDVSPNIAAAALRRLSSPPFLPSSFPTASGSHRNMSKNQWLNQMENTSSTERSVYELLMKLLLKKMASSMENQLNGLVSSSTIAAHDNHEPELLPKRDSWIGPPVTSSNTAQREMLNWYALADMLYSLSSLCNVLSDRNKGGNIIKGHLLTNISPLEQGSIMNLFDSVVRYVSWNNKISSSFVRCVGPRRLVRDVVHPLVLMSRVQRKMHRGGMYEEWMCTDEGCMDEEFSPAVTNGWYDRLMAVLSYYLASPNSLEKLTASDLSTTLGSLAKIYNPQQSNAFVPSHDEPLKLQLPQKVLLRTFMKRLRKHSVRSSSQGSELTRAALSASRLVGYLEEQDRAITALQTSQHQVLPSLIHLPGEDENVSYSFSLPVDISKDDHVSPKPPFPPFPTQSKKAKDSPNAPTEVPTKSLHREAVIMYHTLINDIVNPPYSSEDKSNVSNGNKQGVEVVKLQSLSLGQIADILQAATSLNIPHDDITPAVTKILMHLTTNSSSPWSPLQKCRSCRDISRILLSLQRLRVGSGIYDECFNGRNADDRGIPLGDGNSYGVDENDTRKHLSGLEERCLQLLGERFLKIVLKHEERSKKWACNAKTLAIALRSGVLMFQGKSPATEAILDAASILIREQESSTGAGDDEDWGDSSFLSRCNEFEVSNYLFAFAIAKRFDEDVFVSLTDQMTEEDNLESCTPGSASRAMWSCAMTLSLDEARSHNGSSNQWQNDFDLIIGNESFLQERQVDLFHQLAPLLLYPLSPTDASCAMWSMAKTGYVIDQGIFDQLAQSLASEEMLQQSNTRLISQALWACGKMMEFEVPRLMTEGQSDSDEDAVESEDTEVVPPPYVKCVDTYLQFLIQNQSQLTPKHVSQSIWAIGRLRLSDTPLVLEMADIASDLCQKLNAREVANIVWGLSKVDFLANTRASRCWPEIISKLIEHVIGSRNLANECTAQEASIMLFVLGKLQIRDRDVFASLSSILKNRLHEANSQAITNALWAHDNVGITPPPELLSTWAQDRLGITVLGMTNPIPSGDAQ